MKDLNFDSLLRITVFLVFAIASFYILIVGQKIIVPLVLSFLLAFLLLPMSNFFERLRFPRVLAAITSLLVVTIVFSGLAFLFGRQIRSFGKDADRINERLAAIKTTLPKGVQDYIASATGDGAMPFIEENFVGIFSGLGAFATSFTFIVVVPIYIVLILVYRDVLREFLFRVFDNVSKKNKKLAEGDVEKLNIRDILPRVKKIVQKYIVGMFYVICILFVLNSIALFALGIEHALLFAAFAAVLNVIPFVGPLIGSSLPILFALITKDSLFYPVAVLASFVVIQTLESNLITPNIVGKNVSLNPLVTLVALFIGASVWGIIGMVLIIPLVAVLKEVLGNIPGLEPYAYVLGSGDEYQRRHKAWDDISRRINPRS